MEQDAMYRYLSMFFVGLATGYVWGIANTLTSAL